MIMKKICNEATSVIDCGFCYKSVQDDIGYCGLRRNFEIIEEEKFVKYCFPSVLEWREYQSVEKRREK